MSCKPADVLCLEDVVRVYRSIGRGSQLHRAFSSGTKPPKAAAKLARIKAHKPAIGNLNNVAVTLTIGASLVCEWQRIFKVGFRPQGYPKHPVRDGNRPFGPAVIRTSKICLGRALGKFNEACLRKLRFASSSAANGTEVSAGAKNGQCQKKQHSHC